MRAAPNYSFKGNSHRTDVCPLNSGVRHLDSTCFIYIKSEAFPILPGEAEELVNEGTYGKSLAQYLQIQLKARDYDAPFICCEDWGWWLEILGQPFTLGVCIYGSSNLSESHELCVSVSERSRRRWSWRAFKSIDTAPRVNKLFSDLGSIFSSDGEIQVLGYPEAYPLD